MRLKWALTRKVDRRRLDILDRAPRWSESKTGRDGRPRGNSPKRRKFSLILDDINVFFLAKNAKISYDLKYCFHTYCMSVFDDAIFFTSPRIRSAFKWSAQRALCQKGNECSLHLAKKNHNIDSLIPTFLKPTYGFLLFTITLRSRWRKRLNQSFIVSSQRQLSWRATRHVIRGSFAVLTNLTQFISKR